MASSHSNFSINKVSMSKIVLTVLIFGNDTEPACYNIGLQEAITREPHNILEPTNAVERSLTGPYLWLFQELRRRSRYQKLPLYLVGGAIRDSLLGYPVIDLDFSVEGDAIELAKHLANEMGVEVVTHNRFRTATLVVGDVKVDIASSRTEKYPNPGELPVVGLSPMLEDLQRRDFTINALALPLWQDNPPILDICNGLEDLYNGTINILHKDSFIDDPTRLFRAVRYERRFGFTMNPWTAELFSSAIQSNCIDLLSSDRVRHEFERIFSESNKYLIIQRLSEIGLLESVLECLKFSNRFDEEQRTRLTSILNQGTTFGPLVSVSCGLSENERASFIKRLNMPRDWASVVNDIGLLESCSGDLTRPDISNSEIYIMLENIGDDAILGYLEITGSDTLRSTLIRYISQIKDTHTILKGTDLLEMGVENGPDIGYLLRRLLLQRLDQEIVSVHDERALVELWMNQGRSCEE